VEGYLTSLTDEKGVMSDQVMSDKVMSGEASPIAEMMPIIEEIGCHMTGFNTFDRDTTSPP
jgi:hypothetical protein